MITRSLLSNSARRSLGSPRLFVLLILALGLLAPSSTMAAPGTERSDTPRLDAKGDRPMFGLLAPSDSLVLTTPHDFSRAFGVERPVEQRAVRCHELEPGAALRGCDLSFRSLDGVDLRGADLRSARLAGVSLRGALLQGALLDGADLSFADLQGANLRFASMRHADLRLADLTSATLTDSDLRDADLSSARLTVEDPGKLDAPRLAGAICPLEGVCDSVVPCTLGSLAP